MEKEYLQLNQPDGVPPLPLTGERTLPDVPEENYWYRRHLVVYEWIAERVAGSRVVDMACGEGYGSNVLARRGGERRRRRRQPRGPRARPPALRAARTCASSATWSRASPSPATPSSSCRRSSTSRTPARSSSTSGRCSAPGGVAYVSTPNLLTLAPPGAEKSDNPWHVHEYRAEEFRALCESHFDRVELLGLFHARKLRAHEIAIKLGWDTVHRRLGLTKPFYDRFTPAIAASDFPSGPRPRAGAGLPRRLPWLRRPRAGDLAIVLHSHMPYVEGFGTYPFGEEWLFDAVIRSYLPVLAVARDLTLTVTPVLADQLEDAGVRRAAAATSSSSGGSARPRPTPPRSRPSAGAACEAELARYRRALELLDAAGGDPLRAFRRRRRGGQGRARRLLGDPRGASPARHPPGTAAPDRRRGPLAPPPLRLGRRLLAAGVRLRAGPRVGPGRARRALVLRRPERLRREPLDALTPIATEAGPVALPIDWEAVSWLWSLDGYPSDPAHAQFAGKSLRGIRIWKVGGGAYEPEAAAGGGAAPGATSSWPRSPPGCASFSAGAGRRGLLVFAIDTELLGHWWSEGAIWLGGGAGRRRGGRGAARDRAARRWPSTSPAGGPLAASSWGEGKDLRTWDSPKVGDIAWAGRASRAAPAASAVGRARRGRRDRAARELLAVQSSDWAFLDGRGEAGDYAFQRATGHAEAALEAIDSPASTDPRMRSLAPDLSLAPLLEP